MKTKQVTFKLTVPAWLPSYSHWKRRVTVAWKTLKFMHKPFTCMDCGTKIDFKFPNFTHQPEGKARVILHQSGYKIKGIKEHQGVCGVCLSKRIATQFDAAKPLRGRYASMGNSMDKASGTSKKKCDCCGETKPCMNVIWDPECDIRFGSSWWNGHWMCKDCLVEAAAFGFSDSGIGAWYGNRSYRINEAGAAIGSQHWWDVLFDGEKKNAKG